MARGIVWKVKVSVPPGQAFDYVADIGRHPEWAMDSMTVEPDTAGGAGVGARFKAVGNLFGRPNPSTVTVTDLSRPDRLGFDAQDKRGVTHHEFRFLPEAGGTLVEREMTGVRQPWYGPIQFLIFKSAIDKNFNGALARLRERLEEQAGSPHDG